jgi:hypothetical protein
MPICCFLIAVVTSVVLAYAWSPHADSVPDAPVDFATWYHCCSPILKPGLMAHPETNSHAPRMILANSAATWISYSVDFIHR